MKIQMGKTKVAVVRQDNYEEKSLARALRKSLDLIGSIETTVRPHSRVFVKINHLSPPSPPERAIVTHPAFTKEVLKILMELDCSVTVGDDIQSKDQDGFIISGYRQMCEEMGVRLVNLKEIGFRPFKCDGVRLEETYVSSLVLDADCVVNLPKLKTHSFTIFTGAVKNMFGIIPMGLRHSYHRSFIRAEAFSQMLVDIYSCALPQLTIMDAVMAMEGEGPSAGQPRRLGIILTGTDGVAVDAVASKMTGFNPMNIYTTQDAHDRGLGQGNLFQIDIVGEKIQEVTARDFTHSAVAIGLLRRKIPAFLYAYLQDQLVYIPEVEHKACTLCLSCAEVCPRNAAQESGQKVVIDKTLCIHCLCCHEVCRFRAIRLTERPTGRAMRLIIAVYSRLKSFLGQ